jgi:hypothetical protein
VATHLYPDTLALHSHLPEGDGEGMPSHLRIRTVFLVTSSGVSVSISMYCSFTVRICNTYQFWLFGVATSGNSIYRHGYAYIAIFATTKTTLCYMAFCRLKSGAGVYLPRLPLRLPLLFPGLFVDG